MSLHSLQVNEAHLPQTEEPPWAVMHESDDNRVLELALDASPLLLWPQDQHLAAGFGPFARNQSPTQNYFHPSQDPEVQSFQQHSPQEGSCPFQTNLLRMDGFASILAAIEGAPSSESAHSSPPSQHFNNSLEQCDEEQASTYATESFPLLPPSSFKNSDAPQPEISFPQLFIREDPKAETMSRGSQETPIAEPPHQQKTEKKRPGKKTELKYNTWPDYVLQLPLTEFRAYIRDNNLNEEQINDLKLTRRRLQNKRAGREGRLRRSAEKIMQNEANIAHAKVTVRRLQEDRKNLKLEIVRLVDLVKRWCPQKVHELESQTVRMAHEPDHDLDLDLSSFDVTHSNPEDEGDNMLEESV